MANLGKQVSILHGGSPISKHLETDPVVKNCIWHPKPFAGPDNETTYPIWTSSLDNTPYGAPSWLEWCRMETYCRPDGVAAIFEVQPNTNVFHIQSIEDAQAVDERFWVYSEIVGDVRLNFELLLEEGYDAIHVDPAFTHASGFYASKFFPFRFWDCESTVWLRHRCLKLERVVKYKNYELEL